MPWPLGKKHPPELRAKMTATKLERLRMKLGLNSAELLADYRLLKKKGYTRAEALAAIGVTHDA